MVDRYSCAWTSAVEQTTRHFVCGHCGNNIASNRGYGGVTGNHADSHILICHVCNKPTFLDREGNQIPGAKFGEFVEDIPDADVSNLYDEARNCMSANGYTAAVLCCRKLLMNIAVSKGAKPGGNFFEYVKFLSTNNYIPPDARDWVDHIRNKGNEAAHEIRMMSREDAEEIVSFLEMLLKVIYEFPAKIKKKSSSSASEDSKS